jgi:hypothetical protein
MKNIMPLLFIALLFVACEDTETNSSAVQANIDSTFFKALGSYAIMDADDFSITIIGMSGNQELTLHTEWRGQHAYSVGPDSESYASFTDVDGTVFTTENEGSSGEIVITNRSDIRQELTGSFSFTSVSTGNDTIVVHKGVFYAVPFTIQDLSSD